MLIEDKALKPYLIKVETDSFTVGKMNHSEKNGDTFYPTSYHTSMEHAVLKVAKMKTADSDKVATLKEYIADFEAIKNEIINAVSHG